MSINIQGYDAIIVKGAPRFRLNKKLIARDNVPAEIQQALIDAIQDKDRVRVIEAAPDKSTEVKTGEQLPLPLEDINNETAQDTPLAAEESSEYTELEIELLSKVDALQRELSEATVDFDDEPKPTTPEQLGDILLSQYGIYTALSPREPEIGDIHPLTLEPMNKYDKGLAYVARKRAKNSTANLAPITENVEQPNPTPEETGFKTFADRTGVSFGAQSSMSMRSRPNDPISEEAHPEPNLHGTTIRPYW